ncbi:energy transducer TonB [Hydrocarboniphaga sp.]|uniref:energy transducer TonB n=1 Tax=Hydrocarboniphaga sp. TaxID=2033016 RepID=UPI003D09675C
MSRFKAALSLYIALAVHLLLILLLALAVGGRGDQALQGSGSGFGGEDRVAPQLDAKALSPLAPQQKSAAANKPVTPSDSLTLAATPIDLRPAKPKPKTPPVPRVARSEPPAKPTSAARPDAAAPKAMAGSGAVGGGSGAYIAQVRAQLSRNRRSLPGILSTAHSEVAFNIAADGAVSNVKLVTSSGIAELDREATALVLRAAPFPAPPDGKTRRLSVPVSVEPPRL